MEGKKACVAALVVVVVMVSMRVASVDARSSAVGPTHQTRNGWRVVRDIVSETPEGVHIDILGQQQPFVRNPPKAVDSNVLADFVESFNFLQDVVPEPAEYHPCGRGNGNGTDSCPLYVASIPKATITGESGVVYDEKNNIYHDPEMFFERLSPSPLPTAAYIVKGGNGAHHHYRKLATTIQQYGGMYYHFVVETLPKLVLLKEYLDADDEVMLLMWGKEHERMYVEALGIDASRIVYYNPNDSYSADILLFPTPVTRITPSREALRNVRNAFGVLDADKPVTSGKGGGGVTATSSSSGKKNKLVYCSRARETSRNVANEEELLDAVRKNFDDLEVVVFHGTNDADMPADEVYDVIELFKDAAVIMGPHGAGLSHMLFSDSMRDSDTNDDAPTTVVEFQFMRDPPMMFWHLSESLDMDYWMVPVPASYWMMDEMEVSIDEVLDILYETIPELATTYNEDAMPEWLESSTTLGAAVASTAAAASYSDEMLGQRTRDTNGATTEPRCPRGSMLMEHSDFGMGRDPTDDFPTFFSLFSANSECVLCPPGTYKFQHRDGARCEKCFHGRFAPGYGNTACRTCPIGTYASRAASNPHDETDVVCTPCPDGSVSWMPGGFDEETHCLSEHSHLQLMDTIDDKLRVLEHVSPESAVRVRRAMLECPDAFENGGNGTVSGFSGPYSNVDGFSGPYSVDGFSGPYSVDGFSGPYSVDGFSGPYTVDAFSGESDAIDCDVLNPPTLVSASFATNSTCPTGLVDVRTRECATCDVTRALTITAACAGPLSASSNDDADVEVSEQCCEAVEVFNNGGCYCDVDGFSTAQDFAVSLDFVTRISTQCSFVPMNMEAGNCPRGSTLQNSAPIQPSLSTDGGDSSSSMAPWVAVVIAVVGVLTIVLLWRIIATCCCQKKRTYVG